MYRVNGTAEYLEIGEYGFTIYGYGCMLGGNHLSKKNIFLWL